MKTFHRMNFIFQVELLSQSSTRLSFQYDTLIQNENVRPDNVEVILLNPGTKNPEAKFFIKLDIDFSKLPQRIKQHSQNDAAMLSVTFSGQDYSYIVPQLFLTKGIEEIFGSYETLQIPKMSPPNGVLMDYVPLIIEFLSDKVRR